MKPGIPVKTPNPRTLFAAIPVGSNPIDAFMGGRPHFTVIPPKRVASRTKLPAALGGVIFCSTNTIFQPPSRAKNTRAEFDSQRSVMGCNAPITHVAAVAANNASDTTANPTNNRCRNDLTGHYDN